MKARSSSNDKIRMLSLVLLLIGVIFSSSVANAAWTTGKFEIYVFDVGQADSQLIVSPTGKTLLIDAGERSWNSGTNAATIAGKIRGVMGNSFNHLDYILTTHMDNDHIGYINYGGIWALLNQHNFTVGKLIHRDAGVWTDSNGDNICDKDNEITWHNAGNVSNTGKNWICYVTNPANASTLHNEVAIPGSSTQIDLGGGVTVKIIESDAKDVMMADGTTPVSGNHTADINPPSENDYSITTKITFNKMDYVTGGDTDGEYATSSYGYTYNNIESFIAPKIGKVEIVRANHHGSGHSSNQTYIDTLNPEVSFISCGSNSYGHPDQTVLDRLNATSKVYITEECDPNRLYNGAIIVNGDIVVKSSDGIAYTVNGTAYTASDPTPPAYGIKNIKINEVLPYPRLVNRSEWVELYNPTTQDINIGGAKIDDIPNGGGAPRTIPAGTIIRAHDYYVMNTTNFFNNGKDAVVFYSSSGEVIDKFAYQYAYPNKSWVRIPDGGPWSRMMSATPTRRAANR